MTRTQAAARARKLFGAKAYIRASAHLSSPEDRATALALLKGARERIKQIDDEIAARLAALDWYQALQAERKAMNANRERAQGEASYHKFAVGHVEMGYFLIKGRGDTWEEAFAEAEKKCPVTSSVR